MKLRFDIRYRRKGDFESYLIAERTKILASHSGVDCITTPDSIGTNLAILQLTGQAYAFFIKPRTELEENLAQATSVIGTWPEKAQRPAWALALILIGLSMLDDLKENPEC